MVTFLDGESVWSGQERSVEFALARRALLREFHRGRIARAELCDAQPELMRAAINLGEAKGDPCPVCEADSLVSVMYAFGPKLPAHGRCLSSAKEMAKLVQLSTQTKVYEVEVCLKCRWNHLERMITPFEDDAASA